MAEFRREFNSRGTAPLSAAPRFDSAPNYFSTQPSEIISQENPYYQRGPDGRPVEIPEFQSSEPQRKLTKAERYHRNKAAREAAGIPGAREQNRLDRKAGIPIRSERKHMRKAADRARKGTKEYIRAKQKGGAERSGANLDPLGPPRQYSGSSRNLDPPQHDTRNLDPVGVPHQHVGSSRNLGFLQHGAQTLNDRQGFQPQGNDPKTDHLGYPSLSIRPAEPTTNWFARLPPVLPEWTREKSTESEALRRELSEMMVLPTTETEEGEITEKMPGTMAHHETFGEPPPERRPLIQEVVVAEKPKEAEQGFSMAVAEGRRLHVKNLSYSATEGDLAVFFLGFLVDSISIPRNPRTDKSIGYGFVNVSSSSEAERAIAELSGKEILERKVSVQLSRPPDAVDAGKKAESTGGQAGSGEDVRRRTAGRGRGRGRKPSGASKRTDGSFDLTSIEVIDITGSADGVLEKPSVSFAGMGARREKSPSQSSITSQVYFTARGMKILDGVPSKVKIMVANLPYEFTDDKLKEVFGAYKPVSTKIALRPIPSYMIKKLADRSEPRKSRGFGFVTLVSEEQQQKAINEMNGKRIGDREIAVKVAIDSTDDDYAAPPDGVREKPSVSFGDMDVIWERSRSPVRLGGVRDNPSDNLDHINMMLEKSPSPPKFPQQVPGDKKTRSQRRTDMKKAEKRKRTLSPGYNPEPYSDKRRLTAEAISYEKDPIDVPIDTIEYSLQSQHHTSANSTPRGINLAEINLANETEFHYVPDPNSFERLPLLEENVELLDITEEVQITFNTYRTGNWIYDLMLPPPPPIEHLESEIQMIDAWGYTGGMGESEVDFEEGMGRRSSSMMEGVESGLLL